MNDTTQPNALAPGQKRYLAMSVPIGNRDNDAIWYVFDRLTRTAEPVCDYVAAFQISKERNEKIAQEGR